MRHKKILNFHYRNNYHKTKLYFLVDNTDFPNEIARATFFKTFLFHVAFRESRLDFDIFFFGTAIIYTLKLILILNLLKKNNYKKHKLNLKIINYL